MLESENSLPFEPFEPFDYKLFNFLRFMEIINEKVKETMAKKDKDKDREEVSHASSNSFGHVFKYDLLFGRPICSCGKYSSVNGKNCDTDEGDCTCGRTHMWATDEYGAIIVESFKGNLIKIGDKVDHGIIIQDYKPYKMKGKKDK